MNNLQKEYKNDRESNTAGTLPYRKHNNKPSERLSTGTIQVIKEIWKDWVENIPARVLGRVRSTH